MTPSARPRRTVLVSIPKVPAAETDQPEDAGPACGWFESSWALRQGLAVQELGASDLPDPDGTLAALWFAALATPQPAGQPGGSDTAWRRQPLLVVAMHLPALVGPGDAPTAPATSG